MEDQGVSWSGFYHEELWVTSSYYATGKNPNSQDHQVVLGSIHNFLKIVQRTRTKSMHTYYKRRLIRLDYTMGISSTNNGQLCWRGEKPIAAWSRELGVWSSLKGHCF